METVKRTDLYKIPAVMIEVDEEFNVRQDYGDIDELMLSILENGVKNPLSGYKKGDKYVVTDGFRRARAIKQAFEQGYEIKEIPFIVEKKGYSIEDRIFDMYIKNSGKNLNSLEQCELFKRLLNRGYSFSDIAKKIGKSEVYVRQMAQVANAPKEVKNLIAEDKISVSLVSDLQGKVETEEELVNIIKPAIEKKEGKKITKKDLKTDIEKLPSSKKQKESAVFGKLIELEEMLINMDSEKVNLIQEMKKFLSNEITTEDFAFWLTNN